MAWQVPGFLPGGLVAAEDLSGGQFRLVAIDADNAVALVSASGGHAVGVLQNRPAAGEAASVEMLGITKAVAGGALTAGQFFGADDQGRARSVDPTPGGADAGAWILGSVVEGAGGAGAVASVKFASPTARVPA